MYFSNFLYTHKTISSNTHPISNPLNTWVGFNPSSPHLQCGAHKIHLILGGVGRVQIAIHTNPHDLN